MTEHESKDMQALVEALLGKHDQIEEVVIKCTKIYLKPSQIFKAFLSALKYKLLGTF